MSTNITKINAEQELSLLLEQYKNKDKFVEFLKLLAKMANDLEEAGFELLENLSLDTAEGVQLDMLGDRLDLKRNGKTDDEYRIFLYLKTAINTNPGNPEILIRALKLVFNANKIQYIPRYPAGIEIRDSSTNTDIVLNPQIYNFILDIIPAGVKIVFARYLKLDDGGYLILDDGGRMLVTN